MNQFLGTFVTGLSTGSVLALVALGLVIIFRATHVLNFAHGAFMLAGAYLAYLFHVVLAFDFVVAAVLATLVTGLLGLVLDVLVMRPMRGSPIFAIIMVTFGASIVITQFGEVFAGVEPLSLHDPIGTTSWKFAVGWILPVLAVVIVVAVASVLTRGVRRRIVVSAGAALAAIAFVLTAVFGRVERAEAGVVVTLIDLVTLGVVLLAVIAFNVFDRSRLGTATRAMASDQEAAISIGISSNLVIGLAWGLASSFAALAGILASSGGGRTFDPSLASLALLAFPVVILGGLDSVRGAVVAGLVIGVLQQLAFTYQYVDIPGIGTLEQIFGSNFNQVLPYVVMIIALLVRPYGFFGTKEVRRA